MLMIEFLIGSAFQLSLYRPFGSGEVNYDAGLLLLSLIFCVTNKSLYRKYFIWIFLGLLATFSRTSLLAACLVIFLTNKVSLKVRFATLICAGAAIYGSFLIRDLEFDSLERMDRFWMWSSAAGFFLENLTGTAFMVKPAGPIVVEIPQYLEWLWTFQQEELGVAGVYPFNFHAFWLRFALAWGWVPTFFILFLSLSSAFYDSKNKSGAISFSIICLVLGATMGLFYISNLGVPFIIGCMRLFEKKLVLGKLSEA